MSEKDGNKVKYHNHFGEITFTEEGHEYAVNGLILPSVSDIMRPMYADYYKDLPESVLETARQRGEFVHKSIELFETLGLETVDEVKDYLRSYKMARAMECFSPFAHELRLTNGKYCGTIDIMARMEEEIEQLELIEPRGVDIVIIDLKATSKINLELVEVQLAGYKKLAEANGYEIPRVYVLHIKKDGYKFKKVRPNVMKWQELENAYFER